MVFADVNKMGSYMCREHPETNMSGVLVKGGEIQTRTQGEGSVKAEAEMAHQPKNTKDDQQHQGLSKDTGQVPSPGAFSENMALLAAWFWVSSSRTTGEYILLF